MLHCADQDSPQGIDVKRQNGWRAYRQSRAVERVRKGGSVAANDPSALRQYTARTLIDTLEPRLMYSADNPFGLAINVAEDDALAVQDAELHKTSLALAEYYQQSAIADDQPANDADDVFRIIYVTTTDDDVDATAANMATYEDFIENVGDDGEISLREAITVANNDASVDIVNVPANENVYNLENNKLTLTGEFIIQGAGEDNTKIHQSEDYRVIQIESGVATIADLTIQSGDPGSDESGGGAYVNDNATAFFENVTFTDNIADNDGGALYVEGTAELENVTMNQNSAEQGGGIFVNETGILSIYSSDLFGNTAENKGGGIYSEAMSTLYVYDSTISENKVTDEPVDDTDDELSGGGIFLTLDSKAEIYRTIINDNTATYSGGGIYNRGDVFLFDSSVSGNSAQVVGGGIHNRENLTAERVHVSDNTAGDRDDNGDLLIVDIFSRLSAGGGGIHSGTSGELNLNYVSIAGNTSLGRGGGIQTLGTTTISNSTIIDNSSYDEGVSGGVGGIGYNSDSNVFSISNTLIANNFVGDDPRDTLAYDDNNLQSLGFNFVEAGDNFDSTDTDITGIDPLISSPTLGDDFKIAFDIDSASGIIDTGSSARAGEGDTSINGRLVDATPNIGGYVFETQSDKVYWSDSSGYIFRSDKAFTYAQTIIDRSEFPVLDIQIDEQNQRLYWLDSVDSAIMSSSLDGTDPHETERLVDINASSFALDIDAARSDNDRFFVSVKSEDGASRLLQYFEDDNYEEGVTDRVGDDIGVLSDLPVDVGLDADDGLLYWIEAPGDGDTHDNEANLGSLEIKPFGTDPSIDNNATELAGDIIINPHALAIDQLNNRVYWSEPTDNSIAFYQASDSSFVSSVSVLEQPLALTYDASDDQLLFSNAQNEVYAISSDLESDPVELITMDSTVTQLEIFSDSSEVADAPETSLSITNNTELDIDEGMSSTLDNSLLQVESDNAETIASNIIYTVDSGSSDLEIFNNGDLTQTFSQHDIDEERITFSHSGAEVLDDSRILTVEFSVTDNRGNSLPISYDVRIVPDSYAPVLNLVESIEVSQGEEVLVTANNIAASDVDTDVSELVFTYDSFEQGQFNIEDAAALDGEEDITFTMQDINNERVTFEQYDTDFVGIYTIDIQVEDGTFTTMSQSLQVNVTGSVDPVYSIDEPFEIDEGGFLDLDNSLFNVSDPDSDAGQIIFEVNTEETTEGHIEVDEVRNNSFTLLELNTPELVKFVHSGAEPSVDTSLKLTVRDEQTTVDIPAISFIVEGVNDQAPVAQNHTIDGKYFQEITTLTNGGDSLRSGATDADNDPDDGSENWTVELVAGPNEQLGTLVLDPDGSFTYTPVNNDITQGYTDNFIYTITDGNNNTSDPTEVQITIAALSPPVIESVSFGSVQESSAGALVGSVQASDPDEGEVLTYEVIDEAGSDRFEFIGSELKLKDDAELDFEQASFVDVTIRVSDDKGLSSEPLAVQIEVVGTNDEAPVAQNHTIDGKYFQEITTLENDGYSLRSGSTDADNDPDDGSANWTVELVTGPNEELGTLVLDPDGSFTYAPINNGITEGYTDTFTYRITDGNNNTSETAAEVVISIEALSPPTIDGVDFAPVQESTAGAAVGTVQASDVDEGEVLTYEVIDEAGNDRFQFIGNELKLKDDAELDFEQASFIDVTIRVSDDKGLSSEPLAVQIEVVDANDEAPVAQNHTIDGKYFQEISTLENDRTTLLAGATDADNDPDDGSENWTVELVAEPNEELGTLVLDPNGTFTYTPINNDITQTYTDRFTYTITDGNNNTSDPAEVQITIGALSPPVIESVSFGSVQESSAGAAVGTVQASDVDEGEVLTYEVIDETGNDRFEFIGNELKLKDDAELDFEQASFVDVTISVSDDKGLSSEAQTIRIEVVGTNDEAPVAQNHTIGGKYFQEITTLENDLTTLLAGATDADNDPDDGSENWTVELVAGPDEELGTLVLDTSGRFTYTPNNSDITQGYIDSFTYTITDGNNNTSDPAEVQITIGALSPPVIESVSFGSVQESTAGASVGSVQASDPDEGEVLTYEVIDEAGSDRFEFIGNQLKLKDDAELNFEQASFVDVTISVSDDKGLSSEAQTIRIEVVGTNDESPVAQNHTIDGKYFQEISTLENNLTTLLAGAADADNDPDDDSENWTVELVTGPDEELGTLILDTNGSFTYTPNNSDITQGYTDRFTYTITDGNNNTSDPADVQITIAALSPPTIEGVDFAPIPESNAGTSVGTVQATDVDEGEVLTYEVIDEPGNDRFEFIGNELKLKDDAELDFEQASFVDVTISVSDDKGLSSEPLAVQIEVVGTNDEAPVAQNHTIDGKYFQEIATLENDFTTLLAGATDADNDPDDGSANWTVELIAEPDEALGTLVLDTDGTFTYTPINNGITEGYTDSFTYTITDGNNNTSDPAEVRITIGALSPPVIDSVDFKRVQENSEGASVGTVQATDPDGNDLLSYEVDDSRFEFVGNELKLKDDTALDYEQESSVDMTVTVSDDTGLTSEPLSVQIQVDDANDSPQVNVQIPDQEFQEGETLRVDLDTFTEQDNDILTYQLTLANGDALPAWLVFNEDSNELQLGEAPATEESAQLLLTVDDGNGGTAQMLFSVSYTPPEPEIEAAVPEDIEVTDASDILDELQTQSVVLESEAPSDQNVEDVPPAETQSSSSILSQTNSIPVEADDEQVSAASTVSAKELFDSILNGLFDADGADGAISQAQRDNVISEFLDNQNNDIQIGAATMSLGNVFDDSVNLALLFSSISSTTDDGFSSLSREISQQKNALDSQVSAAKALVGSTFTVSTGLSVGYILYLLRGGAILSSVLSSLPAWRFVDPLPVLGSLGGPLDGDSESLQSITTRKYEIESGTRPATEIENQSGDKINR